MEPIQLDYSGIHEYQKNRYPYLMIDYATQIFPGISAKGYKNLTSNDWFFKIHFENDPSMPGMLQIEALVQMGALAILTMEGNKGEIAYLIDAKQLKFARKVLPGERLDLVTEVISYKRGIAKIKGTGYVEETLACAAEFRIAIPHILDKYKVGAK